MIRVFMMVYLYFSNTINPTRLVYVHVIKIIKFFFILSRLAKQQLDWDWWSDLRWSYLIANLEGLYFSDSKFIYQVTKSQFSIDLCFSNDCPWLRRRVKSISYAFIKYSYYLDVINRSFFYLYRFNLNYLYRLGFRNLNLYIKNICMLFWRREFFFITCCIFRL